MNVFDLRPRSPSGFDTIPLEFFQDYPEPGVNFVDVGCVFDNPTHWQLAIDALTERTAHLDVDFLLAMDARGFMLAGALAYQRGIGFAMARKPGKLPGAAIGIDYRREYGSATIEILDSATNNVLAQQNLADTTGVAIDGAPSGTNTLTVDYSGGSIPVPVAFNGAFSATNALRLTAGSTANTTRSNAARGNSSAQNRTHSGRISTSPSLIVTRRYPRAKLASPISARRSASLSRGHFSGHTGSRSGPTARRKSA